MKLRIIALTFLIITTGVTVTAQVSAKKAVIVAPAAASGSRVTQIRITVITGDDDLRVDSRVSAFIITRGGSRIQSHPLNCFKVERNPAGGWVADRCAGISNGTRRTFVWNLDDSQSLSPSDLHRFGLAFETGRNGLLDSADNWNLNQLDVEYFVKGSSGTSASAAPTQLLHLSDTPLFRFKTREEWESDPLRVGEVRGIATPTLPRPKSP